MSEEDKSEIAKSVEESDLQSEDSDSVKESPELEELIAEEFDEGEVDSEQAIALLAQVKAHRGPLPSPEVLEKYKELSPRAIDWIFESATKEQNHRHWCDKEPLRQSKRGQTFAFVLAVLVILVGSLLIYLDKSAEGLATILVPLASILGVFVYKEIKAAKALRRKGQGKSKDKEATES